MRIARFDQGFRLDDPNLRWGDPSYLLEPGDPGYTPPPSPEPKPARRPRNFAQFLPNNPNPTNATMETYQFIVQPTPAGDRYMPRPQYRETITAAEQITAIEAELAGSPLTVRDVLVSYLKGVINNGKQGHKSDPIEDLIAFRFTCGGSHPSTTFPGTYDNLDVAISASLADAGTALAQFEFSGEKIGEQSRVSAVFMRVFDTFARANDHYTPDKNLEIELSNRKFNFDPANAAHFVKFKKGDGTLVAATETYTHGSVILARVPPGLTGPVELHLSCGINGSVRPSIYQNFLMP